MEQVGLATPAGAADLNRAQFHRLVAEVRSSPCTPEQLSRLEAVVPSYEGALPVARRGCNCN